LNDAIADAAAQAGLGTQYNVHYVEKPLGGFQQFLLGMNQSALAELAQGWGVRLPAWVARLRDAALPELQLLRSAPAGRPNVYAYCFCAPR
jgi:protease-4